MSKTRDAVKEIIMEMLEPYKDLGGPEQLTVTAFINGKGEASSKVRGTVFITSKLDLTPGAAVVGVPIGSKVFFVVGAI